MIVISVANSIDICSFKLFVLQIAFKYSLNGCMIADSKWTGTRQPRCCILSTNLTSFITRGGRVERFSNSIFLNIDFPNFFLLPSLLISSHYSPFYPFLHPILCICFVILSSVQCSYRIRTYINIISFLDFSVKFLLAIFTQIRYIALFI